MTVQPAQAMSLQDYVALANRFIEKDQTDGWPVIPPTADAVAQMLAGAGRDPGEVLGKYQLRDKPVTVKDVATQAVMAGCLPEYFPIVVAAVEIFMPEAASRAHSGGWNPWFFVSGPIVKAVGLNSGSSVLGPGHRANATIGRAFDLVLINLAGAVTNVWVKSTQGSAYMYGICIAEDADRNPFGPLAVDLGFGPDDSIACGGADAGHVRHVSHQLSNKPEHILGAIAEEMSNISREAKDWKVDERGPNVFGTSTGQQVQRMGRTPSHVVLGEDHRNALKAGGWTKQSIREWLHANSGSVRSQGTGPYVTRATRPDLEWRSGFGGANAAGQQPGPENILVISAGGPGGHSAVGRMSRFDARKLTVPEKVPYTVSGSAAAHLTVISEYIEGGKTDGLPIIPPSEEGIASLVAASGRGADDPLGRFEQSGVHVKVRDIAEQAWLTGCKPEYMPVVVAAFEMVIPTAGQFYNGTEGFTPWFILNGPIRYKLAINSATNVFGPTIRANAAIGRAIRLGLINLGGFKPGRFDRSTMGQAYQYTCAVVGENEEDSPWAPISTELGYAAGDSTLMMLVAGHARQGGGNNDGPAENLLRSCADKLATIQNLDERPGARRSTLGSLRGFIGMGSNLRTFFKEEGWTRQRAQELVYEHLQRTAGDIRRLGYDAGRLAGQRDDDLVHLAAKPEDILLVATGGGGAHNMITRIMAPPRITKIEI